MIVSKNKVLFRPKQNLAGIVVTTFPENTLVPIVKEEKITLSQFCGLFKKNTDLKNKLQ